MKVCPKCGSKRYISTLVCYIVGTDKNKIKCKNCGWEGKGHQLIEKKEAMLSIRTIIEKHTVLHGDGDINYIEFDAIAHEICGEIERLFLNDERYKRAHEIPPLCWREFKGVNGVVLITNTPFKKANGIKDE